MDIYIPTTKAQCPATLGLAKEGLLFNTILMIGELDYGRLLHKLWKETEGFIIVEHDVVPWPGAIYRLMRCPRNWCAYEYPSAPHALINALGCIKINALPLMFPDLADKYQWQNKPWNVLDGCVIPALISVGQSVHIHEPPVAHVKR